MTKSTLRVLAGATAFEHLQQHGLRQQDIHLVLGASGGPKWFCLFGLDQYLFGEFFKDRSTPLSLVGSSAGAWRFACVTHECTGTDYRITEALRPFLQAAIRGHLRKLCIEFSYLVFQPIHSTGAANHVVKLRQVIPRVRYQAG